MQIVMVGAGRLATQLGWALKEAGHDVVAVWSRTMESAEMLASQLGATATNELQRLPLRADVFVVSVKDVALESVVDEAVKGRGKQLFLHTAGSMAMSIFHGKTTRYGVLYPMQTFSKERRVDFTQIPVFIEASDIETQSVVRCLAESVSEKVQELSTEDRKYLHLAAVFACNFTNHCYDLAAKVLESHGMSFEVMLPLVDETARKVHELAPHEAQTGPAVRYDENVISMQAEMLKDFPALKDIYERMSLSIFQSYHD